MKKLAIGFPGMHYTCREPLMERLFSLYRERGYEILPLDYSPIPFREMDSFPQFLAAAEERTDILLEKVDFDGYDRVVFISKSLGTVPAARWAARLGEKVSHLVLTPLAPALERIGPKDRILGLVIGSEDPALSPEVLRVFAADRGLPFLLLPGFGHSLKKEDDPAATDAAEQQILALCKE